MVAMGVGAAAFVGASPVAPVGADLGDSPSPVLRGTSTVLVGLVALVRFVVLVELAVLVVLVVHNTVRHNTVHNITTHNRNITEYQRETTTTIQYLTAG